MSVLLTPKTKYECCNQYAMLRVLSYVDENYQGIEHQLHLLYLRYYVLSFLYMEHPSHELKVELSRIEAATIYSFKPEFSDQSPFLPKPEFLLFLYYLGTFGENFDLHRLYGISDTDNAKYVRIVEDIQHLTPYEVYSLGMSVTSLDELLGDTNEVYEAQEMEFSMHLDQSCCELQPIQYVRAHYLIDLIDVLHVASINPLPQVNKVEVVIKCENNRSVIQNVADVCSTLNILYCDIKVLTDTTIVSYDSSSIKYSVTPTKPYHIKFTLSLASLSSMQYVYLHRHKLWRSRFSTWRDFLIF